MIHFHEWEKIGNPKHEYYSYVGAEKVSILCRCKLCGKVKKRYYLGKWR